MEPADRRPDAGAGAAPPIETRAAQTCQGIAPGSLNDVNGATTYQRVLATLTFFTLAAGDFWRYLLSWWGWGAIVVFLVTAAILELVRSRVDVRRLPLALLGFVGLATVSLAWSAYPG